VPMAPGTAWLLVLLSSALFVHGRWPSRAGGPDLQPVTTALSGRGLSCWCWPGRGFRSRSRSRPGWPAPRRTVGGIPVGRMSLAFCRGLILTAAAAMGCLLGVQRWRRVCQGLALVLWRCDLRGSAHAIVSYAVGVPLL